MKLLALGLLAGLLAMIGFIDTGQPIKATDTCEVSAILDTGGNAAVQEHAGFATMAPTGSTAITRSYTRSLESEGRAHAIFIVYALS